jgi:two-component system chemotaxis sensor kinase CheA
VRLDTAHIQRLGVMAEDLLAPRLAGRARLVEAQRLFAEIASMRRERQSGDRHGAATASERRTGQVLHAVEHAARHLAARLSEDHRTLRAMIDSLIVELREARMMPASELLAVFPAMVADLAGDVGKSVRWEAHGTDLLIDRQIAEVIKDPLIHIVRNAVDHGIEPAESRLRAGKPAHGTVTLSIAPADGGRLAIEIADDGAGVDVAAVRESAIRGRLASREEVAAMTEDAVVDLVFQSTLSTRGAISAVSGRGLGLTIVRERAERLGGDVQLRSTPGKGTVVRLEMPAALANFRGVVVRLGDATLICPRDAVERSVGLSASEVEVAASRGILSLEGEPVLFGHLADVLGQAALEPPGDTVLRSGLVLRQGARRGVVIVDEIIGDSEVVVKELRPPLLRVRHVLAAGLLGTGQVALILRTGDVLDSLAGRKRKAEIPGGRRRRPGGKYRLLVVDDSLTTRAMEVGLLEAAGYEVEAAADGLEAWASLQTNEFDAVVSDVDMPNMDGFELTERIRGDARLGQLPIVLVTALEKREDHDRGIRLGANAYMMKSAFDQSMLIDLVRRVI